MICVRCNKDKYIIDGYHCRECLGFFMVRDLSKEFEAKTGKSSLENREEFEEFMFSYMTSTDRGTQIMREMINNDEPTT